MPEPYFVHGEIELPPDAPKFTPARILVELEDVSRADAPSRVVASRQLEAGSLSGSDVIPFVLEVPTDALDESNDYSLRAHLDLNGSGRIERGDYITMQSYPVITRGSPNELRVKVRRV